MEDKQGFFGRILNLIWKRSMSGKKAGLINAFDNNPTVRKDLDEVEKALNKLKKSLADFEKLKNSVK
tara:strand:- start:842 stop:1042 length:201 start_codon:yes stop_codon:yes gene_type:complete